MLIGYARVPSQDQNPDIQLDALRQAGCEQIFIEKATGSYTRARPEWEAGRRALRQGDTLIVWSLDRLGHSLKDLVDIIQELDGRSVGFRSLAESIDTTGPCRKLIFHIFGALAEFEHNLSREQTMVGLAAARAQGRKGGRRQKLSASDVRKAAAMLRDPSVTKTKVSERFGVSRITLNTSLEREGYVP